jgi:hypothetical protein
MYASTSSLVSPSRQFFSSSFGGSTHHDQNGVLSTDDLRKLVPSAFAENAHGSRSERYAYIPTIAVIDGMRKEGFLPVKASQAKARDAGKKGHTKHLIRFRREDQLALPEAREIMLINSHDGSSAYCLNAGVYRFACANGLVVGNEDTRHKVRHSGDAVSAVIDVACRIVNDFDIVTTEMELMKSVQLREPLRLALAHAAIEARFEGEEKPITPEQVLRVRRAADTGNDVWTVFNRTQESIIKGGLLGQSKDAIGRTRRRFTREIKGIDQNDVINRALWRLSVEVAKIAQQGQ